MNKLYLLPSLIVVAAVSCQKELHFPPDTTADTSAPVTSCKLSKILYYDEAGTVYDSAIYSWLGEQLVKIAWQNGAVSNSLHYSNGLCTEVKFYDGSSMYQRITYEYNAENNLTNISSYWLPDGAGQNAVQKWNFQYANGKLTRAVDSFWVYNGSALLEAMADTADLHYTGNNVTTINYTQGGNPLEIIYEHDNTTSYVAPIIRNIFLADYYFGFANLGSNGQHLLALLSSSNNIIRSTTIGESTEEWSYGLDSTGKITELRINNTTFAQVFYSCH